MNPPNARPKRTPELAELFGNMNKLYADVFALSHAGEILGDQRDGAHGRLSQARQLAEKGHVAEARQIVARVAGIVAGWQERAPEKKV